MVHLRCITGQIGSGHWQSIHRGCGGALLSLVYIRDQGLFKKGMRVYPPVCHRQVFG
jgi:hypothetical protein